jgi:hypothetical protein
MIRDTVIERDIDWCVALGIDPMRSCSGCRGCTEPNNATDTCKGTRQIPREIDEILEIEWHRIIDKAVEIARSLGANGESMRLRMHDSRKAGWQ